MRNNRITKSNMTTKKSVKNTTLSASQKVSIGVGLTATALAAVGGYFFYGSKDATKNRKIAKSWMLKAKAEVLEGIESAKHLTKEEYEDLVTTVVKGYKTARKASASELLEFAQNMHGHWKDIERAGAQKTVAVAKTIAKATAPLAKKKRAKTEK